VREKKEIGRAIGKQLADVRVPGTILIDRRVQLSLGGANYPPAGNFGGTRGENKGRGHPTLGRYCSGGRGLMRSLPPWGKMKGFGSIEGKESLLKTKESLERLLGGERGNAEKENPSAQRKGR